MGAVVKLKTKTKRRFELIAMTAYSIADKQINIYNYVDYNTLNKYCDCFIRVIDCSIRVSRSFQ